MWVLASRRAILYIIKLSHQTWQDSSKLVEHHLLTSFYDVCLKLQVCELNHAASFL